MRGFRGNLDGEIGGALVGWALPARGGPARVGLYVRGALLAQTPAHVFRGDLAAQGIGRAGFTLPLTPEIRAMVRANGGLAELRVIGARRGLLGHWRPENTGDSAPPPVTPLPGDSPPLARRLYGDLQRLALWQDTPAPDLAPRPAPPVQTPLFAPEDGTGRALPAPLFAYAEFLRLRDRLDSRFDPSRRPGDLLPFLRHYLDDYGSARAGRRIPLSAQAIDWLNAPGDGETPSRAIGAFRDEAPGLEGAALAYWWAAHRAPGMGCEDCLVPGDVLASLAAPAPGQGENDWPLSVFMSRFCAEMPELAALDPARPEGRRDLTCTLMVLALSRPDLLRYIPETSRTAALEGGAMAGFCRDMGGPEITPAGYARALARVGFDLHGLSFACRTAEGHRAEFARHRPPAEAPEAGAGIDVQVIGPFARTSGLGQATRLSARMLEEAGFAVHRVDCALDDPSSGDGGQGTVWRPARVNLWHLNVEALPLAAAYLPDVFSGRTNIAYPFWELDSPAACHFLGLQMVDALWVAAPFGVESFAPHCACPVQEVGMSYEPLPEIPRGPARARLAQRTGAGPEDFTFLVSFDSFSFLGRKNPQGVLAAFESAFPRDAPDGPPVRLLIKTQNRARVADPAQARMWQAVDAALARDPRITLLDATLPYDEVLHLLRGADAYVSLHRAEGWGFGMIEAMNLGVPVLATAYSANMAFCSEETCWLVDYRLTEVGPDDYIFVRPGQHWAEPDIAHAAAQMRALHADPLERAARAARAQARIRRDFSPAAVGARYAARLAPLLAHPPRQAAEG
ncbi:glycosyltransferase [Mameliella alba]|uniref:glycosyltransferase n=2 Tax=Mameliella alba TaxID=561184 RepID=UPI001055E2C7|nr:glycosyltransferase [Mameliella alba]